VVRQVEPDFAIVDCFDDERRSDCVIHPACRLQTLLGEALGAFLGVLDRHTLADILKNPKKLNSLLGIEMTGGKCA
ncbi:MAG: Rrf2 family transcriptional regulator, partial [Bryobacteraceae bacterium]